MRSGVITYQVESGKSLWGEIDHILERHWEEIAKYKDIKLEPSRDGYARLEDAGLLRCYTARCDGSLVGYEIVFVSPHLHYASVLMGSVDVIYVLPEYRIGTTGIRLIRFADERMRAEGVKLVLHHVKDVRNFGPVLERMGYEEFETTYSRRL